MEIAKAVLMAPSTEQQRGWPTVAAGPRQLFPVANRPILFHQLDRLRQSGMLEATILVDRRTADPIARAVGDGDRFGLAVRYDEVPDDGGLPGALSTCRAFIADQPVFVQHAGALLR